MVSIATLLPALDEREIARLVGIPHDEARMRYALRSNTVSGFDEFTSVIADYYDYHQCQCISGASMVSRPEAAGRAKEIVEQAYRRRDGDIVSAFNDAHDGTNGGLRAVLDLIAEAMKTDSVERYIRDVFDRQVAPNAWEDKVEIVRQFIQRCGVNLSTSIRVDQPERYAQNYSELIRSYVKALQKTSSIFRRL